MQIPPPSYATLFPSTNPNETENVFTRKTMPINTLNTFPTEKENRTTIGMNNNNNSNSNKDYELPPTHEGLNSANYPNSYSSVLITREGSEAILNQIVSLQNEIISLRQDLNTHLPSISTNLSSPPLYTSIIPPPPCNNNNNKSSSNPINAVASNENEIIELKRLVMMQQTQVETLSKALQKVLDSNVKLSTLETEKKVGEKGELLVNKVKNEEGNKLGDDNIIINNNNNDKIGIVELLTIFYNLSPPKCCYCHNLFPTSFMEELISLALNTNSRNLLEKYVSLIVARLNEGYNSSEVNEKNIKNFPFVNNINNNNIDTIEKVLAHLPISIVEQILERTQFPSEIPAYRIAFSTCEVYHASKQEKYLSNTRLGSFKDIITPTLLNNFSFNCLCKEEDADILFRNVRFLWLPLNFLKDELQRCEGLGIMKESFHCYIYEGLILRIKQAIRFKKILEEIPEGFHSPLFDSTSTGLLLAELRRIRSSYKFLNINEKKKILDGEGIDFFQPRNLQERCNKSL